MGEVSNQIDPPPTVDTIFSREKQVAMIPSTSVQFKPLTPIWRFSPRHGTDSTLIDSYEFRAVTHQLNRAIQGSQQSSSPYNCHIKSPFYTRRLDCIYKENAKAPKRVTFSRFVGETIDAKVSTRGTKSFIPRLWKKFKRTFLSKKA